MRCTPIRIDEVVTFRCYTTAIVLGDMLYNLGNSYDYKVAPMSAAAHDATFVGIALGSAEATVNNGDPMPVMTRGLIRIGATSAQYLFGAGLKWASVSTLVADGDAETIAWCYDDDISTRTSIIALIDVSKLAGKQFDAVSA